MKKIFTKLLVLLVAVASAMGLTGCGKDNPQNNEPENAQDLIGKWKLVSQVAETKIGDVRTQKETPIVAMTIEFTSDGKLIRTVEEDGKTDSQTGTYVFKDNKILMTDPDKKETETAEVKELTAKKLVLVSVIVEEEDGVQATITFTQTYEKMQGGGQDPEEQEGPMQVYTVFDAASGVLTYYCDGKINSRNGDYKEIYNPSMDLNELRPNVSKYYEKVKKAVIDPSMKDYPYASMTNLFGSFYNDNHMGGQWYGLENMTEIEGLENLPTANVTDMSFMFSKCASLHTVDLGSFNTANVTDMQGMFSDCGSLDSVNLSSFNTANVKDMEGMFYYCSSLKSLDLCAFNTSKLEDTKQMFAYCSSLETIYCNDDWSQSAVLTESGYMFKGCEALEGGKGTKYDFLVTDTAYARPDGGKDHPGYFTAVKELNPIAFSVAKANQVFFSKANLQYHPTNEVWRFADAGYDIVGNDNSKIARFCDGWIDLFGWGSADEPYNASTYTSAYPSDFTDWGTKNISNGGGSAWRTLTAAEWEYLFEKRANATSLFGFGSVNGTNGLILLPDGWTLPAGCTFVPSTENGFVDKGSYYQCTGDAYASNSYTENQWAPMEAAGAVFLPAAGSRFSKNVSEVNQKGYYWSATHAEEDGKAHYIYFRSNGYSVSGATSVSCGYSVRLVRDVE